MAYDYDAVGDLKALLARFPDDLPIVLAQDPEGNGFGRLSGWSEQMVDPDDYRPEEIAPTPETPDVDEEDAAPSDWQRVLVLWPV